MTIPEYSYFSKPTEARTVVNTACLWYVRNVPPWPNKAFDPFKYMGINLNKPEWRESLLAFGRMSGWVVGPVVAALFIGKWLDQKFDTEPLLFIGTTALAFIFSSIGIVKESMEYLRKVQKNLPTQNDDRNTRDDK